MEAPKRVVPINTEQSPLLIYELLFRLRIRDVMTRNLVTATWSTTLQQIQHMMKENSITGVPVVDGARLIGIISVDDIIHALEAGYINEQAGSYMSTNVVVLEDDMPLSVAISYFDKHSYGRFPVINRDQELVGIITSRNINTSLLLELCKELNRWEKEKLDQLMPETGRMVKVYHLQSYDFENAGKAANEIKRLMQERTKNTRIIRRIAVAAYELEMNLVVHSDGGTLTCNIMPDRVEITAQDSGPGIPDIDQAMEEGFTTAKPWIKAMGFGAGLGLPNVKRVSDSFNIESDRSSGTTVKSCVNLEEQEKEEL